MCNTPACHKLGNKTTMVIILILVGIIQGAVEQYLRISAKQAAVEHNFSTNALGKLIVFNLCENQFNDKSDLRVVAGYKCIM